MMTEKQEVLSYITQKHSALSDTDEAYESAWSKALLALGYIKDGLLNASKYH